MARTSLRARLQRLFSTNVIVRHAGGRKLKIADTDRVQAATRNRMVDRWSRLQSNLTTGGYGHAQAISFQAERLALFRDYEEMDADAIISSALDIYADESTMKMNMVRYWILIQKMKIFTIFYIIFFMIY